MEYISLEACPICGDHPDRITVDLGKPGGRGYPGCHTYEYVCEHCGLVRSGSFNDISGSTEEAVTRAKEAWNTEVCRITSLMERRNRMTQM